MSDPSRPYFYTFPPFVEVVDECGRGIGATARAEVDYDPDSPTYQEITDIRIITPGFGYTLSSDNDDEYVFCFLNLKIISEVLNCLLE